jgi:hypothetical protein
MVPGVFLVVIKLTEIAKYTPLKNKLEIFPPALPKYIVRRIIVTPIRQLKLLKRFMALSENRT